MSEAVPAIAGLAATVVGVVLGSPFIGAAVGIALTTGLSFAFGGDEKKQSTAVVGERRQQSTINTQQSIASRNTVYGFMLVAGPIVRMESTVNNRYLHICVAHASHEIHAYSAFKINDVIIAASDLDASGFVRDGGAYDGLVRIKAHRGEPGQIADPDLVAETSADDNAVATGVAYTYWRLEYDQDVFPTRIPTLGAWIYGKKIEDPRKDYAAPAAWSQNAALIARDYLLTAKKDGGFGARGGVPRTIQDRSTYANHGQWNPDNAQFAAFVPSDLRGALKIDPQGSSETLAESTVVTIPDAPQLDGLENCTWRFKLTLLAQPNTTQDKQFIAKGIQTNVVMLECVNLVAGNPHHFHARWGTGVDGGITTRLWAELPIGLTKDLLLIKTGDQIDLYADFANHRSMTPVVPGQSFQTFNSLPWTMAKRRQMVYQVEEMCLFNRAMTLQEAEALFKDRKLEGNEDGLVGYWPMDEAESEIGETEVIAAANTSDELVDLPDEIIPVFRVGTGNSVLYTDNLHGVLPFQLGDRFRIASSTNQLPPPLQANTDYYAIPFVERGTPEKYDLPADDPRQRPRMQVAASYQDAVALQNIEFTGQGGGSLSVTKNGEPRYASSGIVYWKDDRDDNLRSILSAMAGDCTYRDGAFRLLAGGWREPILDITTAMLTETFRVQTKRKRPDRANAISGRAATPENFYVLQPYPRVTDPNFVSQDSGIENEREMDLLFTTRAEACQRLAKIQLGLVRREISCELKGHLGLYGAKEGENVTFTEATLGFDAKTFKVMRRTTATEDVQGVPMQTVTVELNEIDQNVYAWATGEAVRPDPAPPSNLPDPFTVNQLVGFNLRTDFITEGAAIITRIVANWNQTTDRYVLAGGVIEVQFKKSAASIWEPSFSVAGDQVQAFVSNVQRGDDYDVRIRAENRLKARGPWSTITNFEVGTSGGATTQADWGSITDTPPATSADWGSITDTPPATSNDWGSLPT